jgi:non-specific protein-tyrosine kinase
VLTESRSTEDPELGQTTSLRDLFRIIRRWFWVIALVPALLMAATVGFTRAQVPAYEASAYMLVGQDGGFVQNPTDAAALQDVTQTMAPAVRSSPVAEAAIEELNLQGQMSPPALLGSLRAEQVPDTQFVTVTFSDTDPRRAQQVANAVGNAFSERVAELQSANAENAAKAVEAYERERVWGPVPPVITATVWEQAPMPEVPVSPNTRTNYLLALVLGLMLGLGLAFLLEHLWGFDNWRSPDEVEQVSGVPTVGIVPKH